MSGEATDTIVVRPEMRPPPVKVATVPENSARRPNTKEARLQQEGKALRESRAALRARIETIAVAQAKAEQQPTLEAYRDGHFPNLTVDIVAQALQTDPEPATRITDQQQVQELAQHELLMFRAHMLRESIMKQGSAPMDTNTKARICTALGITESRWGEIEQVWQQANGQEVDAYVATLDQQARQDARVELQEEILADGLETIIPPTRQGEASNKAAIAARAAEIREQEDADAAEREIQQRAGEYGKIFELAPKHFEAAVTAAQTLAEARAAERSVDVLYFRTHPTELVQEINERSARAQVLEGLVKELQERARTDPSARGELFRAQQQRRIAQNRLLVLTDAREEAARVQRGWTETVALAQSPDLEAQIAQQGARHAQLQREFAAVSVQRAKEPENTQVDNEFHRLEREVAEASFQLEVTERARNYQGKSQQDIENAVEADQQAEEARLGEYATQQREVVHQRLVSAEAAYEKAKEPIMSNSEIANNSSHPQYAALVEELLTILPENERMRELMAALANEKIGERRKSILGIMAAILYQQMSGALGTSFQAMQRPQG